MAREPVPPEENPMPAKSNGDSIALKLTKAAKETFLAALRQGYPLDQAAGIAGVSRQTIWRHRRNDAAFDDECEQARSLFSLKAIQKMDKIGEDMWEHWRWRLEKALPETFGKQAAYNTQVNQQNVFIQPILPTVEEVAAQLQERANAVLARQLEAERKYATVIDVQPLPTPDEHVKALMERRAEDPLPD
jgi:hypothetical protein